MIHLLWRENDDLLKSVPGVGRVLSWTLLADLPELGSLSRREIAKLAGLAPLIRDSGTLRGKRAVWGGRGKIRSTLYMSTLVAVRFNPMLRAFCARLLGTGKPKKGRPHCRHAKTTHDPQRHRARSGSLEASVSRRKLEAISARPSQPRAEGRVEIAPLTPNTVACSTTQSLDFRTSRLNNWVIAAGSGRSPERAASHRVEERGPVLYSNG